MHYFVVGENVETKRKFIMFRGYVHSYANMNGTKGYESEKIAKAQRTRLEKTNVENVKKFGERERTIYTVESKA